MKKSIRLTALAAAALASLAFAGTALASFAPKLIVSSGSSTGGGPTRLGVVVSNADVPTAKVTIYVPSAYTVGTAAPGKLGDVTATASAADLGGAILPLTGELDAIPPTAVTTAAATACGITPAQTWDLHLTAAGQTLDIPMFVVATAGPEVAAGFGAKLVVCLPPPDVPVGTPGRATFGAKLLSATFTSSAITEPTSGDQRWTSLWTPYNPGVGTVNAAGTVETQAVRHLPVQLKLTTTRTKKTVTRTVNGKKKRVVTTVVRFSSRALANNAPPSKVVVTTTARGKKVGGASGSFTIPAGVKSVKVSATAVVDSDSGSVPTGQPTAVTDLFFHDLGTPGCTATAIFGGLPCIDATVGGERLVASATVRAF